MLTHHVNVDVYLKCALSRGYVLFASRLKQVHKTVPIFPQATPPRNQSLYSWCKPCTRNVSFYLLVTATAASRYFSMCTQISNCNRHHAPLQLTQKAVVVYVYRSRTSFYSFSLRSAVWSRFYEWILLTLCSENPVDIEMSAWRALFPIAQIVKCLPLLVDCATSRISMSACTTWTVPRILSSGTSPNSRPDESLPASPSVRCHLSPMQFIALSRPSIGKD